MELKMSNQSTARYLAAHKFFSGLSDDVLKFLCEHSSACEIKKGQILFRQGENADKFYVVRNGRISIQMPAIMGPNLEIQTLGEDQVLGWSWLISPYKWSFQAIAEEDSELLMFDGKTILARCEQEPKFGYELLKKFAALMSIRLDAARQKMMDEWNPAGFA
jgi:CRP-like cAMP-binding protein